MFFLERFFLLLFEYYQEIFNVLYGDKSLLKIIFKVYDVLNVIFCLFFIYMNYQVYNIFF